ncbi:Nucleoside-diphosphate-sugar epimerase [Devosia enhydra]|uniref:Nucleoside-diphosphate-sugar epimerase n=1 Tax=Devosia enhydra TaxID=665118 RepID=A0A1K2HYS0_9HYPH|nr:NAD(P)-dependent oxidoreductase [Devosia enhydra]SFZ85209.1 Nucleoside-diphosphate-sugar epimerase [Devosia enhydra]
MRILVTGGSGRVGRFVVRELASAGHEVTSLDFSVSQRIAGVRHMTGDVSRFEDIHGALAYARAEAVVHLAAWSDPGIVADTRTYRDNVAGAFNVLEAAHGLGLKRVILASSAQVYGFAGQGPLYAPVDEEHPLRPLNSYALAKIASEQAGAYFATQKGLNVLSFRIMGARDPADLPAEMDTAAADPEGGRFLLWTRSDGRDIALACRLALEADAVPSGVYNITGAVNLMEEDAAALVARWCPEAEIRPGLKGAISPMSIEKARNAFGYQPRYNWTRNRRPE